MFTTTQLKEVLESAQYITSQLKNLQQQKYLANSGLQRRQKIVQKSQTWMENEFNLLLFHQELDQAMAVKYTGYD